MLFLPLWPCTCYTLSRKNAQKLDKYWTFRWEMAAFVSPVQKSHFCNCTMKHATLYYIAQNVWGRKLLRILRFWVCLFKFFLWKSTVTPAHNWWCLAIHESFSTYFLFSTNSQTFSPSKASRYTVRDYVAHWKIDNKQVVWPVQQQCLQKACLMPCHQMGSTLQPNYCYNVLATLPYFLPTTVSNAVH